MMWFIFINSGVDYHFHTFYVFIEIYQLMYEMLDIQRKLWFWHNYLPASRVPPKISKIVGKPSVNFMKCQLHLRGLTDGLNSFFLGMLYGWKVAFFQHCVLPFSNRYFLSFFKTLIVSLYLTNHASCRYSHRIVLNTKFCTL